MAATLPLVHLTVLKPFVDEVQARGFDAAEILDIAGIPLELIDDENQTVHVSVIHEFLEDLAATVDDPYLAARVGGSLNTRGWPPLINAAKNAKTLGDFLTRYISEANQVASSATQVLRIEGEQAVLGDVRIFEPRIVPAQNDAFMASLFIAILSKALGEMLDPSQMTVVVSEPKVLPENLHLMHLVKGDRMGCRILFPSSWLSAGFDWGSYVEAHKETGNSFTSGSDLLTDFRQVLRAHVSGKQLTAVEVAALVGMSRQKLASLLRQHGTTISAEMERARLEKAKKELAESDRPIAEIAEQLSYSSPANFARAFTRVVGVSPRAYRTDSKKLE